MYRNNKWKRFYTSVRLTQMIYVGDFTISEIENKNVLWQISWSIVNEIEFMYFPLFVKNQSHVNVPEDENKKEKIMNACNEQCFYVTNKFALNF